MSTRSWRHRSSTAASQQPDKNASGIELRRLVETLAVSASAALDSRNPDFLKVADQLQAIHKNLASSTPELCLKDTFRHLHGFQILLNTVRAASGSYHPTRKSHEQKEIVFKFLKTALDVLAESFKDNQANRAYFKKRVDGGGWAALEQAIASTGVGGSEGDEWTNTQLFGCLFEFATDGPEIWSVLKATKGRLPSTLEEDELEIKSWPTIHHSAEGNGALLGQNPDAQVISSVKTNLYELSRKLVFLRNPEIISTVINFWRALPRSQSSPGNTVALTVILILLKLSSISVSNLQALHSTRILSTLLPLTFDTDSPLLDIEKDYVEELCRALIALGISTLCEAQYLVRSSSEKAAEFLLYGMKLSRSPGFIQFDQSLNGFSSVELSSLGRPFPPTSSTQGYTFSAWIRIDEFDETSHTNLFGAYDVTQTCFVLAYLEKDTKNFILQTSIKAAVPSKRFKSVVFKTGQWYHIALVHRRPRTVSSSKAALYVNGEFAEQVRCQYPASPPTMANTLDTFASFTSTPKLHPVRAFFGTPQDLAAADRLGKGMVGTKWSLASAHLIEDALSDDLIAVHHRLGPRYHGNFQDNLGSFQTYEDSAQLNMRNDMMHPGKDDTSEITLATQDKASSLMPESRLLFSVSPFCVIGDGYHNKGENSSLVHGLSKAAASNLYSRKGSPLLINAAIPSINEALTRSSGTALLIGEPVVVTPQALDDAMWRLGGCNVCLKLVQNSYTRESIVRSVQILLESVTGSWRNSEAMERDNGYAILAALIREKLGIGAAIVSEEKDSNVPALSVEERDKLSFELLSTILGFVGYNHRTPAESLMNNPFAYRFLLLDFDIWRRAALITQKLYYKQFVTFVVHSKFHQFNSIRLSRLRIIKKLLEALKAEPFSPDVFPSFMEAFAALVRLNLTTEILRSLSLFVTYALHKPSSLSSRTPKSRSGTVKRRGTIVTSSPKRPNVSTPPPPYPQDDSSSYVTKRHMGVKILEMYAEILCDKNTKAHIQKFAKTVTNRWLLYLLGDEDPQVVVFGTQILARLLVVLGPAYVTKFTVKTGGFTIMQNRLSRWWDISTLWPICFSILFGVDPAVIDFERPFELFSLLETFGDRKVVYPALLPVIVSMLQHGLNSILHNQDDPDSPLRDRGNGDESSPRLSVPDIPSRRRSMSLTKELESRQSPQPTKQQLGGQATVLNTVIRFLAELHTKSQDFREFVLTSDYVRLLLSVIFPVIVSADAVSPETELNSRDSALTFEGDDVIIRPLSQLSTASTPIVRTAVTQTNVFPGPETPKAKPLRRGSSYILLTSKPVENNPAGKFNLVTSPKKIIMEQKISNALVEGLMELVVGVFLDQILVRKEFPGFGLFSKVPPGFQEHQAYFESFVLRNTISQLENTIQLDQKLLSEPRVITNMARFSTHICESVFEGWFLGGAEVLLDFTGTVLEYLQRPDVSQIKTVRLCSQAVQTIRGVFLRVSLLRLSELDDEHVPEADAKGFMDKLFYWQTVIVSSDGSEGDYLKLICYQLYMKLVDSRHLVRLSAADLWRILLVQKPEETTALLVNAILGEKKHLATGFKKLMEIDNETFVKWIDSNRNELDTGIFASMSPTWDEFVAIENRKNEETLRTRISKRRERLQLLQTQNSNEDDTMFRYDLAANLWMKNAYSAEHIKYQRGMQDQQDNFNYLASAFAKIERDLTRPCAVFDENAVYRYKLDRTEGRNRMRIRMLPDRIVDGNEYQPKRKNTGGSHIGGLKLNTQIAPADRNGATPSSPAPSLVKIQRRRGASLVGAVNDAHEAETTEGDIAPEDDFELIDDPNENNEIEDGYEDKNRKVMRSLKRGEQVQHVFNMSRIVGLEACEGILILGKDSLYIMDNVFQRLDGELVDIWQAPKEERDPYLQMIAGQKIEEKRASGSRDQTSRSWRWNEVMIIFKRRYLFRDVALEIFFTDGRSYLLTLISQVSRDDLYLKIATKAPHTTGTSPLPSSDDAWRLEALKVPDEAPMSLGSKFGSIFNSSPWNPAMRRWAKGEISNFHYLMLVNTMAGRTFNDLTQYPVFPWVIADYTSEELDLNNPKTFRDLSKPMGAQSKLRHDRFTKKYRDLAEFYDEHSPPFHYGTHYSSAMVVTSYLIRLEPFVKSFLLLQGGNFDHPDRMFSSIQKAWESASRDNEGDVRELIPEFFFLPEFLTNSNGYNFGVRQGDAGSVDSVVLPPWAKGDPKIFITKNREALESPYVSQHLHQWIDLVFGCKQRGEAAVENTNVFYWLSYHGAIDLDKIEDPVEQLSKVNAIHSFGQTPYQIFQKPHQHREDLRNKVKRLDTAVDSLSRLPFPLIENKELVASLTWAPKLDRLLCSSPLMLNQPSNYDKYLQWGFADNSVRFFNDSKKVVGLVEGMHIGQISTAAFVDSRTLITAGIDCSISVWTIQTTNKTVDLAPKTSLFGHKYPVHLIVVSKTFSTILTASTDGQIILWDLNRLEFVRKLNIPNSGTGNGTSNTGSYSSNINGHVGGRKIEHAKINDVTGDILLTTGKWVLLYTLNGDLILEQNVCSTHSDPNSNGDDGVRSCAFYEGSGNEWLEQELVFTGHARGVVCVWRKCVRRGRGSVSASTAIGSGFGGGVGGGGDRERNRAESNAKAKNGKWHLELVRRLDHVEVRNEEGSNTEAAVSCIIAMPQTVYTGDEDGRVCQWDCVQRER